MNAAYAYSERALVWLDPDNNRIAIDIFDLSRAQFEAVCPDPAINDRVITTDDGLPNTWVRTVSRCVKIDLHFYTEEPPLSPVSQ